MNKISYILLFSFLLITNIYADKKWISIEPINTNKNTKNESTTADINISQIQPLNKLIENAKVVKRLIDSTDHIKEPNTDTEKNWYLLDSTKNN